MADRDLAGLVGPWVAGTVAERIDGRTAVFLPAAERILYLNETATTVADLCDGTRTEDEIVQVTASSYRRPTVDVSSAVRGLLTEMRGWGLFVGGADPGRPESR
jgi:hypothetical protein